MKRLILIIYLILFSNSTFSQQKKRSTNNIIALSNTVGIVKYFYPSKHIQKLNWNNFKRFALIKVKDVNSDNDLIDSLLKLFVPIVPEISFTKTVRINNSNTPKQSLLTGKIKYWEHLGYGYDRKDQNLLTKFLLSLWKSSIKSLKAKNYGSDLPVPDSLYFFKIKDSLYCGIPIALYAENRKHKYKNDYNNLKQVGDETIEQLSVVIDLLNIFKHFYLYKENTGINWDEFQVALFSKVESGIGRKEFEEYLRSFIINLNDRHIGLGNKKKLSNISIYRYKLMPLELLYVEDSIVISKVNIDSLSVKKGDIVLEIDNKKMDSVLQNNISFLNVKNKSKRISYFVQNYLNNYVGEKIKLKIKRGDSTFVENIQIERFEKKQKYIRELSSGYYYIELSLTKPSEIANNITQLRNAKGIIADSRFSSSKSLYYFISLLINVPVESGNWYSPIIHYPNTMNVQLEKIIPWKILPDKKNHIDVPVIFLSGLNCVSTGESLLEIVKNYKLGKIMGESSAGTNGDIDMAFIDNDYLLIYTQLLVLNRDGTVFFGNGVIPDIIVKPTIQDIRKYNDYLIEYALNYLKGKNN
jgi:hypothetical protein